MALVIGMRKHTTVPKKIGISFILLIWTIGNTQIIPLNIILIGSRNRKLSLGTKVFYKKSCDLSWVRVILISQPRSSENLTNKLETIIPFGNCLPDGPTKLAVLKIKKPNVEMNRKTKMAPCLV